MKFSIADAANEWTVEPSIKGWTYNEEANSPVGAAKMGQVKVDYKLATDPDSAYTEKVPENAGEYVVRFSVEASESYGALFKIIELKIEKAKPVYQTPTALTGTTGKALGTVTLPAGWAWSTPAAMLEQEGEQSFKAMFTPEDANNYKSVEVSVSVRVEQADTSTTEITTAQETTATTTTAQTTAQTSAELTTTVMATTETTSAESTTEMTVNETTAETTSLDTTETGTTATETTVVQTTGSGKKSSDENDILIFGFALEELILPAGIAVVGFVVILVLVIVLAKKKKQK